MYKRCLSAVFVMAITSLCLLHTYGHAEITLSLADTVLQCILDCLVRIQTSIRPQADQPIRLESKMENPAVDDMSYNYNLSEYEERCPQHRYTIRMIERRPMVVYIEQFLTANEMTHLIELSDPLFGPSLIFDDAGAAIHDKHRTSNTAKIKRRQSPVVKCIEERVARFQGNIDVDRIEPLQVVRYRPDQQFKSHYDWFSQSDILTNGGQRISTFFTYLQANCSLGETEFLDIPFNLSLHERFCDILICDAKSLESGLRFRPIPGNSVFWYNVDEQGSVDYLTYHAGRPPGENGHKIGLNTWTREDVFLVSKDK